MKSEPHVGDSVWVFFDNRLLKCNVEARSNIGNIEPCFELVPEEEACKTQDRILLQARYFFYNARDAINAGIEFINTNIKKNKKELDLRRQAIKELKTKRADLQRMLEKYPKPS